MNFNNISNDDITRHTPKTVFILGIEQRSGTNFLWRLLDLHPQCHVGSVGEDFLLEHSHFLSEYAERLYQCWIPKWRDRMGTTTDFLLKQIGDSLISFIKRPYYMYPGEPVGSSDQSQVTDFESRTLITKSPSVKNIRSFFQLFPDSHLLILVRDGRSVVESGMKSFNWNFEDAVRRWNKAANEIIAFLDMHKHTDKKCMLVRYEDVVKDTEAQLRKILTFLGLEQECYDFDSANNLHVFGSSEIKKDGKAIHWNKIKRTKDFSPIKRWETWEDAKHIRFNWIAGEAQVKLGYSIRSIEGRKAIYSFKNRLLDWKWNYRHRK